MAYHVEEIVADNNLCGEAPLWDHRNGRLLWVDNEASVVFQYVPATSERTVLSRDLPVSGLAINEDRRLIFGGSAGLHVWEAQNLHEPIVTHDTEGLPLQINDMIADPQGRIYAGTLYWGAQGMERLGKLYLIEKGGKVTPVDDGIEVSNGLGFSPDDRTLYYADSTARKIFAYDVDARTGGLSRKRLFVQVSRDEGIPDGLTVDAQGYVWCAHWYGSEIVRYDPDGKVERRIPMPAKQVSSVMFGGKDLNELYVTSAGNAWRSDYAPRGCDFESGITGGSLYRIKLDIQGRCEHLARF